MLSPRATPQWLRTVGALVRVSLMTALQYRSNFLLNAVTGLARTVGTVAPLLLVFQHRPDIVGWTPPEASLVIALFLLLTGLHGGLMEPNLGAVVEQVRKGSFDLVLMKPADAQLLVSMSRIDPARVWDFVASFALGGWAIAQIDPPSMLDVMVAFALLLAGLTAMYGIWIFAIAASFFFVRVDNLRFLLMSVSETGRWPLAVFADWVQVVLTILIPIGIITSFPAMALRGMWSGQTLAVAGGTALAFAATSRFVWKRSLAAYTSASS